MATPASPEIEMQLSGTPTTNLSGLNGGPPGTGPRRARMSVCVSSTNELFVVAVHSCTCRVGFSLALWFCGDGR